MALLRWLIALAVAGGTLGAAALALRTEPSVLPVRIITVDGAVHRLSAPILARNVTEHLQSGILTQDLRVLKSAVETVPWVRSATLRRVWPDRIELAVTEHQPMARWGKDGLVTAEGVVFRPEAESFPPGLPLLVADDAQAPRVTANYLSWRDRLGALGLRIATLALDPRGAWTLELSGGIRLELGTERIEERLARFVRTYPQLAAAGQAELIDVRYANGLAVRWAAGAAPGDAQVAQTESAEPRAPEARAVRTKAPGVPGEGRNKSRNRG